MRNKELVSICGVRYPKLTAVEIAATIDAIWPNRTWVRRSKEQIDTELNRVEREDGKGMPSKVTCLRDGAVWAPNIVENKSPEGIYHSLGCPKCGRGYISRDGGRTFVSDRFLIIVERDGIIQ